MSETQDTELTLSTGKLLGVFFVLVVICGVFFSLGYAVGKNSAPASGVAIMDSSQLSTVTANGGAKPPAGKAGEPPPQACAEGDASCQPPTPASTTQPAAPPTEPAAAATNPAPEMTTVPKTGAGFMVQVAAVSKKEDAEALQGALQKKQYPVIVVPNESSHLYHVQVGPFPDPKEAEAMRQRLASDGYNAIVKK
jgi:DedD protein